MSRKIGYRRVSSEDQNLDRQDLSFCDRVFEEKLSGCPQHVAQVAGVLTRWPLDGFKVFDAEASVLRWAQAAHDVALDIVQDPVQRAANLRHDATWFVGVDALPNDPDGSINGAPLGGCWRDHVVAPDAWHRAQLSVVYPGYA